MAIISCYNGKKQRGRMNMSKTALVIIDIQNDITKNYKDIIENINTAID